MVAAVGTLRACLSVVLLASPRDRSPRPSLASAFAPTRGGGARRVSAGHVARARFPSAPLFLSSSDAIEPRRAGENVPNLAESERLRERARALRLEAAAAEQNLRSVVQQKKASAKKEADEWIGLLLGATDGNTRVTSSSNSDVPSAQTLLLRIKENQIGFQKLQKIAERLHERETTMLTGAEGYLSKWETAAEGRRGGGFVLGDYENNSDDYKREETDRISGLLDRVLQAVQMLDDEDESSVDALENGARSTSMASRLRVRVSDLRQSRDALFKRRVDSLVTRSTIGASKKDSIDAYTKSSIDGECDSGSKGEKSKEEKMMERLFGMPSWLPSSLAPFAAASPGEVSLSDWKRIKTDLLADSGFMCTSWDSTDVAAVFHGNVPRTYSKRSASPEAEDGDEEQGDSSIVAIFEILQDRLEDHSELGERVRLFLMNDNEWSPSPASDMSVGKRQGVWDDSEARTPPPVIIALAREVEPEQDPDQGFGTKSLAALSTVCSILASFAYALSSYALNPVFFNSVVKENNVSAVPACLPVFVGVLAIVALHEAGHLVAAKWHKVKLGVPIPLPSLQIGTFGCITPLRSFPSTRRALFDVAVAGPGASMLASIILLVVGLNFTIGAQSFTAFPMIPAATMKSSFLIGSIVSVVAPRMMMVPLSQPVPVHPLFVVGLAGLFLSVVNLLPIGRLDGGRASMAVWGRQASSAISLLSLLALAFYSFSGTSGIIIFWGAIVVLTQRNPDIPAVDEVTGVGDLQANGYIALLVIALLTLAPFPGGVGSI